jgi:hypothetical protein
MRPSRTNQEFDLVAACCRWPLAAPAIEAIRAASNGVDWDMVLKVADRHRVEALVENALRKADVEPPAEAAAALRRAATETVRQNVTLAAECVRLQRLFEPAGIPLLFIKGVTLGLLAYGTLSLKMGWDIDVLVPEERVSDSADALAAAGYACITPADGMDRPKLIEWHRLSKESVWRNDELETFVELHTRLVDNPAMLPGVGPGSAVQHVAISANASLPTLAKDELFAYLCVHGASSAWFRIKWIADVGALIGRDGAAEVERLYRRSQELGAGRAAAQALLLCAYMFETPVAPELRRELWSDRRSRYLYRAALRLMTGGQAVRELHETRLGTLPIHVTQLFLRRGLGFKLTELTRQIASPGGTTIAGRLWRKVRKAPPA